MFSTEELEQINQADDLHIAPFRADGKTHGTPTWIWEVVVNNQLYVRAYNGKKSRWYQSAIQQKRGKIIAAGMTKEVVFTSISELEAINNQIDEAYKIKYSKSPYLASMISNRAKAATIQITLI